MCVTNTKIYLPSLEQAEKTDSIFKKMGHKIKQAIWI